MNSLLPQCIALASRTSSGGMIDAANLVARTAALPVAAPPVAPATPAAPTSAPPPAATPMTTPATPAPPPGAPPSASKPRAPQLKLNRFLRSGSKLRVSGTLARAWRGMVTVTVCAGRRCVQTRATARQGRFSARLYAAHGRRVKVTVAAPATRGYGSARLTRIASA